MPRGEFDRSERRARTRAQLLDAAARVYARRGFDSATLDEVAEEAGFTKGAVYDHFGSKEKLLSALLGEHLSAQIAEQIELFDPAVATAERPRAGADRWMQDLEADPNAFRLFVEAWVHGQRDQELGAIVADGMNAWRATFRSFGAQRTEQLGEAGAEAMLEQVATVMLALGTGLGMVKLSDPDSVSPRLLGAVNVLLLRALETSPEARALLAEAAPDGLSEGRPRR
jgi:AcrR family transcriptional regulator